MAEHAAAVRRNDASFQVAAHSTRSGHTFKFDEAEILARGDNRVSQELLESWFTGPKSINKCNDLPTQYSVLKLRLGGVTSHAWSAEVNTFPNTGLGASDVRAIITPTCNARDEIAAIIDSNDEVASKLSETGEFKKHVNSLNKAIDKLRKAGALKMQEALTAKATDAAMAHFYGLPKVHKTGVPLRPIVSLRDIPTFGLSKWLYQRFRFLTEDSEWMMKSAEQFLRSIRHLEIEPDEMMVSFDVVSLFTSIPTDLAISTIDKILQEKYDETDQRLKRTHVIELLELCLRTFFTFNNRVCEQKKGTPMGSPLSGLIAEAVLQRLERLVFRSSSSKFWARYVDDTFVVIKRNDVQDFKVWLNLIFPDIQFTMEEEDNNHLPFLDVNVTRMTNEGIRNTVYRKATNTRRILRFRSNHPIGHKRSCVRALFQRVQTPCNVNDGRRKEGKYLHSLVTASGYPRSFIRLQGTSYEARVSSDGADSVGEQIAVLSTVAPSQQRGESQPGVRRPTRDIDPPTRPNSRPRFPHATATDQPVKLWGEGPRAHGPSSDNSDRAESRGHTSAPAVGHGET
nr:unnamed protein product [Spirometra erinaceieuropaei]